MKNFLLLILVFVSTTLSAQNSYKSLWNKVYKDEISLLPKSALEKVNEIYKKAEKDKNEVQKIKALIYQSKFALALTEKAQLKVTNNFKTAIHTTEDKISKALLNSLLAEIYWGYYNQNRWKIQKRTKTSQKENSKDFRTWDLDKLFREVHTHFQISLKEKNVLQKASKKEYKELIKTLPDLTKYRPTLYDFLAHNALDFYKNSQSGLIQPKEPFLIDDENYLKEIESIDIQTKDVSSTKYQALKLYQSLILFHKKEKQNVAYFKILFQAIAYVEENGTFNNKKEIRLAFLEKLTKQYPLTKTTSSLYLEIAKTRFELGKLFSENKDYQFEYVKSLKLCDEILEKVSESPVKDECEQLKKKILEVSLNCQMDAYIPIQQFSKIRIDYKNIKEVTFSILKLDGQSQREFAKKIKEEDKQDLIKKLPELKEWIVKLPDVKDHQKHSTEIVLPKLNQGFYLLVGKIKGNKPYLKDFQITNLTLLTQPKGKYQVLDRNHGKPIVNAKVSFKKTRNYRNDKHLDKDFFTNSNGEFEFSSKNYYYNVNGIITTLSDTAVFYNIYVNRGRKETKNKIKPIQKAHVFTDRSIYRPGQTVHFKTIVLEKYGKQTKALENQSVEVGLYDVNRQEVKKIQLYLNEFGTAASTFQLPLSGLTGKYNFKVFINGINKAGYANSISVEEYKRPKFKTSFEPVKGVFKVNDVVEVKGIAKALAGSTITDAKVVYRVVRKARYPRWCWWIPTPNNSQEIEQGETKTDTDGNYTISFKAIPDASVSKKNQPTFYYTVSVDVTDVNGETRSAETEIAVGYHSLNLAIQSKDKIGISDSRNKIVLESENLNRVFVPVVGVLKIYKLIAPKHPQRKTDWIAPDQTIILDYKTKFPNENFEHLSNPKQWQKGDLVYQKSFDTGESKEVVLGRLKKWQTGAYIIVAETQDIWGQKVKDERVISVFDKRAKKVADKKLFTVFMDQSIYQPKDVAIVSIGSASKDMTVFLEIEKNHKTVSTHQIHLSDEIKTLKIPITEQDRGGFAIKWHWVNLNSMDSGVKYVFVPHKPTNLSIETRTFRDLLEPGAKQKWSFKIKGAQQDKVAAEVLASMYDASLDQFKPHSWQFNPIPKTTYRTYYNVSDNGSFKKQYFQVTPYSNNYYYNHHLSVEKFNWFGFSIDNSRWKNREYLNMLYDSLKEKNGIMPVAPPPPPSPERFMKVEDNIVSKSRVNRSSSMVLDEVMIESTEAQIEDAVNFMSIDKPEEKESSKVLDQVLNSVKARTNFNETAFFFPQLRTNKKGEVSFEFTMPEDLTRWKLQLLAHNKQLHTGYKTLSTVTQKQLMVIPNAPRFLREGDAIRLSSKIANLAEELQQGRVKLELIDPITGKNIDAFLQNNQASQSFSVTKKGNTSVSWDLQIPENVSAVQYKIVAASNHFSDGEQNVLPVLSNRMLVTETLPLWVNEGQTKTFTLDRLKNNQSNTLKHHQVSLEITSNPAWYAVQALPYLMEYPYECAEQTFARYYANQLASHIVNSNPNIKEVFKSWSSSEAMVSNLEKNQELKSIIIQETPWLRDAQSEIEQKKRIALLFDLSKMEQNLESAIKKLEKMQMHYGGFPWFKGSNYANRYITQHIVQGFAHLQQLGVEIKNKKIVKIVDKAQTFLDQKMVEDHAYLLNKANAISKESKSKKEGARKAKAYLAKKHLSSTQLQYLYVLSFNNKHNQCKEVKAAVDYYTQQAVKYWKEQSLYNKGLLALIHHRNQRTVLAQQIIKSLQENSVLNEEMGRYWKENKPGWYWYKDPIVTQSLLIEVFSEVEKNNLFVDELKQWLLKNKQTQQWKTTKATSEAVYALLLKGSDWLSVQDVVEVRIGEKPLEKSRMAAVKIEAGTGYFKTTWKADEITPAMATVTLTKKEKGVAWGGLYWQYFEDLDKIKSAETPLKIRKEVFVKKNTDAGLELQELNDKTPLKVGDLLTVRIEISTDRTMEFVHMKDMRASGLEPVEVLSKHKWQDGLGYYQSTKDTATHFFFDKIKKGVYVFEYDVRVSHKGMFSNGITTLQSMYAPEFSSHSKGIQIEVK